MLNVFLLYHENHMKIRYKYKCGSVLGNLYNVNSFLASLSIKPPFLDQEIYYPLSIELPLENIEYHQV